jgi:hypothetical protein
MMFFPPRGFAPHVDNGTHPIQPDDFYTFVTSKFQVTHLVFLSNTLSIKKSSFGLDLGHNLKTITPSHLVQISIILFKR